ncbi:hypothetical protein A3860_12635 [Niastella vici]|uniref:inorganic diphosphatase n=1 Tax=Niastella vici TaxID=1703345 RepID=A0A1V9G724_9BACT|nr:inorganic diphosphatase [Niastella vici]OQP66344.1 hypothetical protein A3860_12635 [Niastella vici]
MQTIEVVIESPRATQAKYKFDPKEKIFKLKRLLPLGMVFPYDFGFISGTVGEDGDPLDALLAFFPNPFCVSPWSLLNSSKK